MTVPRDPDPPTVCPVCSGTGFVVEARDGESGARRCVCRLKDRDRRRWDQVQIPPRYQHCLLEEFATGNNPSLERARRVAVEVIDRYPVDQRGLLFMGPCGVGKTHLATAVLQELVLRKGAFGLFAEFCSLLRRIQDTYDRRSQTPSWVVLQPALDAEVLLLDDLGATRTTPWVLDTLGLILNERYNNQRMTLITTNRPPISSPSEESLEDRIGARLASRLSEMCFKVEMEGEDFRRQIRAADHHLKPGGPPGRL